MLMQMGQFVDHDITLIPEGELNCCRESLRDDPLCANIEISRLDLREDNIYKESRDRRGCIFCRIPRVFWKNYLKLLIASKCVHVRETSFIQVASLFGN